MKCFKRLMEILVVLTAIYLAFTRDAYAYLDPGTGSLVIQIIVAALLGAAFTVKVYWQNIKAFFAERFSSEARGQDDDDEDES